MKLFYDETGKVVGSFEGATPEIETKVYMPGANEIAAPDELVQRFNDLDDEAHPLTYQVSETGEVLPQTPVEDSTQSPTASDLPSE